MVIVAIAVVAAFTTSSIPLPQRFGGGSEPAEATVTGSSYGQMVMADSPDYYWRMGGTSAVSDEETSSNSPQRTWGSPGNSTPGAAGALLGDADTAFAMNNSNNITIQTDPPETSQRTLEGWIKVKTLGSGGGFFIGTGGSWAAPLNR